MWWRISGPLVLSVCLLAGCGKDEESSTTSAPPAMASAPDPSHPTTQQLLSGPRTPLDVKFAPITLQVPLGWDVKSYNEGAVVTIEGQTPTDVVNISVPVDHTITDDQEKSLEAHAAKDLADHPDLLKKVGVREISGGKVIEHLQLDLPSTQPTAAQPLQTVQWTFTLCVPSADPKEFTAYELRFLGMTLQQYKADQDFLRSIIDSLTYTPSTPDTNAPPLIK